MPYYALRVIEMPVRTYIAGLLRPLVVATVFAGLCQIDLAQPNSIVALAFLVACQALVFGLVTYVVALQGDEKRALWKRCKELVPQLRLLSGVGD